MDGREVFFPAGEIILEGRIKKNQGKKGVVICHPHPQFGGTMNNNVVDTLVEVFFNCGFTTLKFNFRGVGRSEGRYDGGKGEQRDVASAINYLADMPIDKIHLAGYSFGAWVGAQLMMTDHRIKESVLISPPVGLLDFGFLHGSSSIKLVIYGERDNFCPYRQLSEIFNDLEEEGRLKMVKGADHFYWGKEEMIRGFIQNYLREGETC